MDQVSPALQYSIDKVETCSWDSSSPHSSLHNTSCPLREQASSPASMAEPEMYTVRMASGSRDSTEEPLTPASLQVVQEQRSLVCKEESRDYNCAMAQNSAAMVDCAEPNGEEVKSKNYGAPSSAYPFEGYDYTNQMVNLAPPPLPQASTSSAEPGGAGDTENTDSAAIPLCLQFGTIIPPEEQNQKIIISLEGADLWEQFYRVGTEMIITKSGRRMFPGIVITVGGLEPDLKYTFALEFNPVDNARYKYINTKWVNIGKAEAHCEEMLRYVHPESPSTGKHWMASKVSFKKVKVTNNKNHKKGLVVALNSMHKYQPRVVISRFHSKKNLEPIFTHELVQCTFIGVTAYQNDRVTQLKIDHNPFAKAFRETGSDNESYGYGMMGPWPPLSPLLSPYGAAAFSPEGLPVLSPGCIPPAGPSPLPQFNSAFCSWESPPYSPATGGAVVGSSSGAAGVGVAAFRSPFQNPGTLPSPTMLLPEHHRQVLSSRLMAQQSPPISPLLYPPGTFPIAATAAAAAAAAASNNPQHQFEVSASTLQAAAVAAQQYGSQLTQQKSATAIAMPEMWLPKNEFSSGNSGSGAGSSGATGNSAGPIAFEVSSTPVGYNPHAHGVVGVKPTTVMAQQGVGGVLVPGPSGTGMPHIHAYPSAAAAAAAVPKIEQASSPADMHMDIQP